MAVRRDLLRPSRDSDSGFSTALREPVVPMVRASVCRNNAMTSRITATPMIAWLVPSPSSPAPAARRCAAKGFDRSARLVLDARKPNSPFTEDATQNS